MPSHRAVTFAAHDDDDVLKTLPEEKAGAYNDEEAVFYPTLSVAKDGLYDVGVINGTDGLEESDTYYSRRGRRQSIFSPWSHQYRKRISLHGKAIYFTAPSKRKCRHRRMKFAVYSFLERPTTRPSSILYHVVMQWQMKIFNFLEQPKGLEVLYHLFTFALVFGCLVLSVLATIPNHSEFSSRILYWLEIVILVLLTIELALRIWSAGCRSRYQGFVGILRFCKRPFCLIDIIVILSSFIVICAGSQGNVFATTAMRSLRFLQILRMVRMDRRGGTWKLLSSVVLAHSKELITAWYIGFLTLIFASFLVFQAEKDTNQDHFGTYADALWWGLITLTTIGYGDKVPKTWIGRLIASGFTILGISFFALPAKGCDENYINLINNLFATVFFYLMKLKSTKFLGILGSGFALKVQEQHRQKHFARRRMPAAYLIQCMWRCYAADKNSRSVATWLPHLRARLNKKKIKDAFRTNSNSPKLSRKSTFRHRFGTKSSVSSGNIAVNGRVSPTGSAAFREVKNEVTKSSSLAERLSDRLMRQNSVLRLPKKDKTFTEKKLPENPDTAPQADEYDEYSSASSNSDSNETVLTEQHKAAVRSIRMMKFLVARRKFKEALRPYDVKDVIEQYSSGHVEMLARIKNLQNRVDMILGISSDTTAVGNPPSYYYRSIRTTNENRHCHNTHTNSNSMNSRLLKVESDVENVDRKLEMILHLLSNNCNSSTPGTHRKRRSTLKKDPLQDDPPSPSQCIERLNRFSNDYSPDHKKTSGVKITSVQKSSPSSGRKQSRNKVYRKSGSGEIIELLPASAWNGSTNESNVVKSNEEKEVSSALNLRETMAQNTDFSNCDFTSMDSCHLTENEKGLTRPSDNSDSDNNQFAEERNYILNPTTSSFNWNCSPSVPTYDDGLPALTCPLHLILSTGTQLQTTAEHLRDTSDGKSETDQELYSFKGVEEHETTSSQSNKTPNESTDFISPPTWTEKSANQRNNKHDESVIINLNELKFNELPQSKVLAITTSHVPKLNRKNSKSLDNGILNCGDNASASSSNQSSPTYPNKTSPNKTSSDFLSFSTPGVAGDTIGMSNFHNSSLDKRCSLPLTQISEFSTCSELV